MVLIHSYIYQINATNIDFFGLVNLLFLVNDLQNIAFKLLVFSNMVMIDHRALQSPRKFLLGFLLRISAITLAFDGRN